MCDAGTAVSRKRAARRWASGFRQALQQRRRFTDPGPLAPLKVPRHARLSREDAVGPLARLRMPLLRGEKAGVVEVGLREGGGFGGLREKRVCLVRLAGVRIRVRQKRDSSMRIVAAVPRRHLLQVADGSREVSELNGGDATAV